jgi:hypothetical protein
VQALVQAVGAAREAQQQSAATLTERAKEIAARRAILDPLLARFGQLGEAAKTLNAALQKVAGYKPNPYASGTAAGPSEEEREYQEALVAVDAGMLACATHAEKLAADANAQDFEDLGRQADGLRQQVLSAKNRLGLLQKRNMS